MAYEFNFTNFLNDASRAADKDESEIVKIPYTQLIPSEDNFYHQDGQKMKKLEDSIELLGVQQPLIVCPADKGDGWYEVLAGHSRLQAVINLCGAGRLQDACLPCMVDESGDRTLQELKLIMTNSTQRERTPAEKMLEARRIRELLEIYKKEHPDFRGNIQQMIGHAIGVSKSEVGRLENIDRNLNPGLKRHFEEGGLNVSTANELARLSGEKQKEMEERLEQKGSLSMQDAKEAYAEQMMEAVDEDQSEDETIPGSGQEAAEEGVPEGKKADYGALLNTAEVTVNEEAEVPAVTDPDMEFVFDKKRVERILLAERGSMRRNEREAAEGSYYPEGLRFRNRCIVAGLELLYQSLE